MTPGVLALVTAVLIGASGPVLASASAAATTPRDGPIDWRRCTAREMPLPKESRLAIECATVEVPVDYDKPDGRTLELFVSRRPSSAPDPIGPLFVNQGGPGKEAAYYAATLSGYPAFDRFDIIGMDPRGVGRSTALECPADLRDVPPFALPGNGRESRRYERAVSRLAATCAEDPNLAFFGSNNAARDMDTIRDRLGADQLSYFGKSYGSDLGTAYVSRFPERVRAAILDGGTDFTIDPVDFVIQQATAGQQALARYFEHCRATTCAWTRGSDPAEAWDRLLRAADDEPIPRGSDGNGSEGNGSEGNGSDGNGSEGNGSEGNGSEGNGSGGNGSGDVTGDRLRDFGYEVFAATPDEFTEALDALVLDDDPSAVLEPDVGDDDAADALAFLAVTCMDLPVDEYGPAATRLRDAVPDVAPNLASVFAFCGAWPKPGDRIVPRAGDGRGPIAVVSTVGDVPTPYVSGLGLARSLDAPVITWDASSHTAYLLSPCVQGVANALLVDLVPVPPDGVTCPDDRPRPDDLVDDEPLEPDLTSNT